MNILVLQHAEAEHPGIFRSFLDEDGHSWTTIHLYRGDPLPESMAGYDALWVLGGPMEFNSRVNLTVDVVVMNPVGLCICQKQMFNGLQNTRISMFARS